MKILLVLPAGENFRVTTKDTRVPRRKMLRFSILPLTTIAALTPSCHEVGICDENVEPIDFDADVDLVGITFMTAVAPRAYQIAAEFRKRGKIVVAGGYHTTLCPDDVEPHFDSLVIGEAEIQWQQLLQDVEAKRLQKKYVATHPCDPALIPTPRRDLTTRNKHHYVTINAVHTGRGCFNACNFCSITAFFNHNHRNRPLDHVLNELKELPKSILFIDDNIIANRDYARKMFEEMIPLRKKWVSQCTIDIADDPDLLILAKKSGCIGLFIGIESIQSGNLATFNKKFNQSESYPKRLKIIRNAGIAILGSLIVGGDSDDPSIFADTLKFLQQNRTIALQLNILTPLPGTPLFEKMEREGRIIDRDWTKYDYRNVIFQPAKMTPSQLQQGADWLYRQYYRLDRIFLHSLYTLFKYGLFNAILTWRLNFTYRYDNQQEDRNR